MDEATKEQLWRTRNEWPDWFIRKGVCELWYATLRDAVPACIVRGESLTDLADEMTRATAKRELRAADERDRQERRASLRLT